MNQIDWLKKELQSLQTEAITYQDQAFYLTLSDLVIEQNKRIEQMQRELDGRMWEH